MASKTSDSFLVNTITGYLSVIQRKNLVTKEQFHSIRRYFFQTIGFFIVLYYFFYILILFYLFLKLIFQICFIIICFPLKIIELILPKLINYEILFSLFCLCSILSFFITKFSYKTIEIHLGKRYKLIKNHLFILTFIILLFLQSLFILIPIAISIQKQQKLSSNSIIETNIFINKKLSSSLEKDPEFQFDIEDNYSVKNEKSSTNLKQQTNNLVQTLSNTLKEKKKKSKLKEFITFHQKFNNWNIFHQTKLDSQESFSLSTKHLPLYNISSIYTAYTNLNCYDYTKTNHHYQLYIYFLNIYRYHSPFPVYLSILKSNGPKCYVHYPNSSCGIRSKLIFSNLKRKLYRFIRFWIIISIPIIILIIIYKNIKHQQYYNKSNQLLNKNQQIISDKIKNLSSEKIFPNLLNKKIEKELHLWIKREKNNGYQNISQACRIALNNELSKQNERLNVETLQFADAKIHSISQPSVEPIVINAILDIDHLIFNIINTIKDQYYSIEIPKLTGELEIFLINNTNQYSIEVKFKQIHINYAEIIDSKNILLFDEKQSIIKLFKEIISQIIVQCCFYLTDNQENILNESRIQPSIPPTVSQLSNIPQQCETSLIISNNENNQEILPEKEVKKLLIRIVKAVRLHDVEQPFCILELNQPKQIHQTSIAKNGLNPYWDERFLFECNDKSNQIRLQIIDRKKSNKKLNTNNIDKIYADISIPFSYVTSTIYKQDLRITPEYPDSIIRIEVKLYILVFFSPEFC